ncbi:MAG: HEAT repeat domain-containing protein [Rubritepida sp.]|nr:HEAT repeat domain-containing protein [Rubritepida sp.]
MTPARQAALDAGVAETRNLAECLAVDQAALLGVVCPELDAAQRARLGPGAGLGITRRMALAGGLLRAARGPAGARHLARHPSDTVRGWAAFALAAEPGMGLTALRDALRPLADDAHFGVREWAWLALRPHVAADVAGAIAALQPWTAEPSERLRRFAVEATRPRGVWCPHLPALRHDPGPGLALLEPLRADTARYVQDSVANWLNDAAKDRPDWVRTLLAGWERKGAPPTAARILRRAGRGLRSGAGG